MGLVQKSAFHGASGNVYPANRLRRVMQSLACDQEGVLSAGDMVVTPDSPASLRVRIGAGRAWVGGMYYVNQGAYLIEATSSTLSPYAGAAHATLGRRDLLILRVHDLAPDGGGASETSDLDAYEIIAGTAGASPSPPSIPNDSIPLAELLIPAAATTISTITDRRPFAAFLPPGANLFGNSRFDSWSRGASVVPDGWAIASGTVAQDATNLDGFGKYAAAVTNTVSTQADFTQKITSGAADPLLLALRGRLVTITMRVRASTASRVRLMVSDGTSVNSSGVMHTGGGAYETLSFTADIHRTAAGPIIAGLRISTGTAITAQVAAAGLYLGSVPNLGNWAVALVPTPRQLAIEDLFVGRIFEHGQTAWQGWSNAAGMVVKTPVQFQTRKAATPTITLASPTYTNGGSGTASDASVDGFSLQFTTTSSGAASAVTSAWDAVV